MTIGLLHLSDIHFKGDGSSPISGRDGVIAGTLAAAEPDCGAYVVLISGDLAFSGKPQEYAEAEQFLNRLRTALSQLNAQPSVQMVAIPGNHDCNFEHNSETRKMASEYLHRRMDDFKPTGDLAQKCLAVQ
ncbi:MAG: metallophosphoesterase, partial [Spirochaetia bacterium]|nr:metallophosphoesterase [Spirochaetia bacterium]